MPIYLLQIGRLMKFIICVLLLMLASKRFSLGDSPYDEWRHSGSVFILTTPEGANLAESVSVENFPALLRLHRDYFDFKQALPNGEDLRITTSDGKPLAFQIEHWNAADGIANVWVSIPRIEGNARQEVKLYWGKSDAAPESNGIQVFNASNGYLSVSHMNEPVRDEAGALTYTDTGTSACEGMIGAGRRFADGKGVFCGDKITSFPTGSSSHSSEAWFRADKPNGSVIAWGNEHGQGKVVMQFVSPPHIRMDCYFSGADIKSESRLPMSQWIHVVHTYEKGESRIYVNGKLDGINKTDSAPLAIKSPAHLFLGGWYHNYNFVGDLDEVRISNVVRSPEWIQLQYQNQKPMQTLIGPLVQPGNEFAVSATKLTVGEGRAATITAKAAGAQKLYWILNRAGNESVVSTDRSSFTFESGRVVGNQTETLTFKAIYPDSVKSKDIAIEIREEIPEPIFTLAAPAKWNGRDLIEVIPQIENLQTMKAAGSDELHYTWTVDDVAVIKKVLPGKLQLKRAQGSGPLRVSVAIDNGGAKITQSATIIVKEPPPSEDPWVARPISSNEQPEDNQFIARDSNDRDARRQGTLVYAGTLADPADSVFVRVFADDKIYATETAKLSDRKTYSLAVKLQPGLVKYRTEFGSKIGDKEAVLHKASNIVCGDVYLIVGQSNAVATDFGKGDPPPVNEWVRTFGATDGGPEGSRLKLWAPAQARGPGGVSEIGYWGMELGRQLVESEKIPICIINGAVGGTRIDQHQRNEADPTDVTTIYGRMLWRVQQARLTHGIRAIIWHQGENDQGADGPTGGYGWETYKQYFVDLAAAWKEDYPNVRPYYAFQIWPKACAMGIDGSDDKLREVQRTLPTLFSNLTVLSTLGINPPGGCHYPAEGYAEFARMLMPLIRYQIYHHYVDGPNTPPNLKAAYFLNDRRDEVVLEFDYAITWSDPLVSQFYLDGQSNQVAAGSANGNRITLKLKTPTKATKLTYLDSDNWSQDNLLYGENGMAALTFCDVPIASHEPKQ